MSNHSIEELKRQYEQARQKQEEANRRFSVAENALKRALIAKAGYLDKIVTTKNIPRGVLVQDAYLFSSGKVFNFSGPAIKADGSVGSTNRIIYRHDKILEVREVQP